MKALSKKKLYFVIIAAVIFILLTACSSKEVTVTITVSGTAEESGVLSFLGYSMNVYQDIASNPCGDCADQPVHLYVGASAEEAAQAIADQIERADDLWVVSEIQGNKVVLTERTAGTITEIESCQAPSGLSLSMEASGRSVSVKSGQAESTQNVDFPENPQRLAAVYGPSYELLVMLGAEDKIVVRADVQTDDFPWAEKVFARISEVPMLENVHNAVNFEELMKYDPDIVYTFPRANELNQLSEAGVAALAGTSSASFDELKEQVRNYAATLGSEAEERAEDYCTYFDETLDKIQKLTGGIPESERKSVYYAGVDILTTYGKYSDIIDVIEAAGGVAVSADLEAGNRSQIDYEQLMAWNPDVIFIDHGGMNDGKTVEEIKEELTSLPTYAGLKAVKEGQVYASPSGVFYWDMGLQKILLVEYMAKILYPDYCSDIDMEQEIMDFYSRFYGYELTREEAPEIIERKNP